MTSAGGDNEEMTESMHDSMSLDGDIEKLTAFYDSWADDYDDDIKVGNELASMMLTTLSAAIASDDELAHLGEPTTRVLDAACGTGAVGKALHDAGWRNIRGIDLSTEMVRVAAARGVYQFLEGGVDLTTPMTQRMARSADIVTVGGVFTIGHLPPESLRVITTLVQHGGVLVVSARQAYLDQTNFIDVQQAMIDERILEPLIHDAAAPYTMDSTGDYFAWRVR